MFIRVNSTTVCSIYNIQVRRFSLSKLYYNKCSRRKNNPPWDILFFGNDNFALESLKPLYAKLRTGTLMSSLGVVTKDGTVTHKFGVSEGLTMYNWPLDIIKIQGLYDIGMVVSFGNLIPKDVINTLPLGCINVHASLLPRWRGAAPIIHTIMAGDVEAGVTIMRIHPYKFDVGEIVRQYRIFVKPNETAYELEKILAKLGAQLLMECLRDLPRCLDMAVPQPKIGITHASKVVQNMSTIHWRTSYAQDVYNLHRALSHIYPLKTTWQGKPVKLMDVSVDIEDKERMMELQKGPSSLLINEAKISALNFLNNSTSNEVESLVRNQSSNAGKCSYNKIKKHLKVTCADDKFLILHKLQISGKLLSGHDFYNGYMTKVNKNEWLFIS